MVNEINNSYSVTAVNETQKSGAELTQLFFDTVKTEVATIDMDELKELCSSFDVDSVEAGDNVEQELELTDSEPESDDLTSQSC
ncbi:MAG: hypothetical protein JHC93_01005 [Parachlamydiales bacterium]|nr:hypothetical protein [Parachlamydiales bacterium]